MHIEIAPNKSPGDVLPYGWQLADFLGTDTISSSTWTIPTDSGITLGPGGSSFTDTDITVWLAGGTPGKTAIISNRIVTAGGMTKDLFFQISIT